MRDGGIRHYRLEGLRGNGRVAGRDVACLTVDLQLEAHAGYELQADDPHDLSLLESLRR